MTQSTATTRPVAFGRVRRLHFVGIGGAGMGGIAEVLHNLGFTVTGSDVKASAVTRRLEGLGVMVTIGHDGARVSGADAVVTSSAVAEDNPEVVAARAARIPLVPRAEMLAELMRFRQGVAIAGTHGKTTTTSLVASCMAEGGLDPTFVIGGRLNSAGANARLGTGPYLVAEADESDASFLYLKPVLAVVTNIDADHLGTYGGDFANLRRTFEDFLHHLPFYGLAVLCADDDEVRALSTQLTRPVRTYGLSEDADVQATDLVANGHRTAFTVKERDGEAYRLELNLPGRHNVQNALAAVVLSRELGVSIDAIRSALSGFEGIGRRFQRYGALPVDGGAAELVDDYGHHPREIAATLQAVRDAWPNARVVAVFQPHRYSRTRDLFDDFARVLAGGPDVLLLAEVYSAGEAAVSGADGRALAAAVRDRGGVQPVFVETLEEIPDLLRHLLRPGDVVVTLGAGSIGSVPGALVQAFGGQGVSDD